MTQKDVQGVIDAIATISGTRNYWFVRTMSGKYYHDFTQNSFIAIGYDAVPISELANANTKDNTGKIILSKIIKKIYPKEARPNYIGKQLLDFTYGLKKGDIVMIPSTSSDKVSIGQVVETPIYQDKPEVNDPDRCPFEKRKRIKWLKKDLVFDKLDPALLHLKYTRRTITSIDTYTAGMIDRMIIPLFIKENDAHLALNIQKQAGIKAYDLFETWAELFRLSEEFGEVEKLDINKRDYEVKINVQSPGIIEFVSYSFVGIVVLSTFVAAIIGAEFEANNRLFKFSFKSEGLIKKVSDFLDKKEDRKSMAALRDKMIGMDINPEEITKILEQLKK